MSKKLVYGVGVDDVNVGRTWKEKCPFYDRWRGMLRRCYSEQTLEKYPTYRGCSVCEEWLTFSNFKSWMEQQDWEGKHLDKDLLVKGNKVYSPETCIFVDKLVNRFTTERTHDRGKYPLGVTKLERLKDNPYAAQCSDPFTGKRGHIGVYSTPEEAHLAWKRRKHEFACMLAESDLVTDPRLEEALKTRYL